jgi:hypothetical protein
MLLLTTCVVAACGSPDTEADPASEASESATPGAAVASATPELNEGSGTLWVDGVQKDGFSGDCRISRRHGAEDLGSLEDRPGIKIMAALDNVEANTGTDMTFVVYSDSVFTFRDSVQRGATGTLTRVAFESEQVPKGTSTKLALVSFTGTTNTGKAIIAHIVCELQNKFT